MRKFLFGNGCGPLSSPFVICCLIGIGVVIGSRGDASPMFQDCVALCRQHLKCPEQHQDFGWVTKECFLCRHNCIRITTKEFLKFGFKTPQYFGKCTFRAITLSIAGVFILIQFHIKIKETHLNTFENEQKSTLQNWMETPSQNLKIGNSRVKEPASTIFSLLNLYGVWRMLITIRHRIPQHYRCATLWRGFCYVGMVTWICSALFHAVDVWLTEYLDYFTACAMLFYAMFSAVSFACPSLQLTAEGRKIWIFFVASLMILYIWHIYVLAFPSRFDYGYNMAYCIYVFAFTSAVYLIWLARQYFRRKSIEIGQFCMLASLALGCIGVAFEVFDFEPILGIFDSHSIFHLCTVPIPWLWAKFISCEASRELSENSLMSRKMP